MNGKDWTLIVFTLSMQFSVGLLLFYNFFVLHPLFRSRIELPPRCQWMVVLALITAITGVVFSFLHLGNPAQATKVLSNLGDSWLSREILCVLIYSGLLVVIAMIHFVFPKTGGSLKWMSNLTCLAGVILIFVMSRIYMIPSRPAWNTLFTPANFFLAALLMGSGTILMLQINHGSWASQKALAIIMISIAVIQLGILPVQMSWLSQTVDHPVRIMEILLEQHMVAFYLRFVLYIIISGLGVWALVSIRSDILLNRYLYLPVIGAWCAIICAQIIDRFLFYIQYLPSSGF
jgi:anaerobic dimethyl sulfoxide reductase subunit C (anchor subunit)